MNRTTLNENAEPVVASSIRLECGSRPVSLPAIELGDELLSAPKEIHDEPANPDVCFRLGKAVATKEGEKAPLEFASGVIESESVPDR